MVKQYYLDASQMVYIPAFFERNMWDRTETLTPNTTIKCITPIGAVEATPNIYDICMSRAKELAEVAKKEGKKIHVFWSGGLDSTTVFLALREVTDAKDLVVMYTKASLKEYPGFFEAYIHPIYETYEFSMNSVWLAVEHACSNGVAVTGEIADQLFGSVMYIGKSVDELQQPWRNFNVNLCKQPAVENLVFACPTKVTNVAEFLWWFNYSSKYQNVQLRMLVDNTVTVLNKNIFHFFDTAEFNNYSVSTPIEEKLPGFDTKQYKKPLRDVIHSLSGDFEYAYNKPKVRSLVPVYGKYSRSLVAKTIDLNWVRGYI